MSLRQWSVLQYGSVAERELLFALLFLLVFFFSFKVMADPWKGLQSGDQAGQEFLNKVDAKKAEAGGHPFYTNNTPKEANFSSGDLIGRSQGVAHQNPASQFVHESSTARVQFKIDPQTDPLLVRSQKIMTDPLTEVGGKGTHIIELSQASKDETLVCEEGGEDSLEICTSELDVKVIHKKVTKEKSSSLYLSGCKKSHKSEHVKSCPALLHEVIRWRSRRTWQKNPGPADITAAFKTCLQETLSKKQNRCKKCNNPRNTIPTDVNKDQIKSVIIVRNSEGQPLIQGSTNFCSHGKLKGYSLSANIKILYEEETYEILPGTWISNCDRLEERVDQGLCFYNSKVCTQGPQTRLINGVSVTQDCWQQTFTYSCSYPSKNDCGPLRARGCVQIASACKQKVGNSCVVYSQTYLCKGGTQTNHQITGGQTPFCLDGNCRDQSWEKNDEMMSSLAQLSILKEMQGQFKNGLIFKGQDNRCSKYILSFKDCCGSGKGWGNDLGLSSCSKSEKNLSQKRKAGFCHYVGTFCAKKILGQCIKKKSTYCCFNNKLLKAFHEQGRPQIGLGWGDPESPLCRGYTIEEIQRIDFSKLDLREVFEDLMKKFKPGKMQNIGKQVGDRLEIIKKGITPNIKQQQKQRDGA